MFNFQPFPPEDALPPEKVRFTELRVEPWPDGRRVRVHVGITPFQQRPYLNARLLNAEEQEIASATVVETMENKLVFTMHIRGKQINGQFTLLASLSYPELGTVDEGRVDFETEELPPETE